ncbi:O-antigen polymerase [Pseudomonas rhodesiae]|jgi:oligosaccharide repeat unit polymerase|uniref:Oligosaccharide repeat unit polymerase n=2 Tax=Pseudomonas TaxID=286 RepID=A0A8I1EAX9_9PSED|nr:O-antigen polymerase [Pseudomonas rhodesiae]MBI6627959.1 oligosaccharide repeat unit polymerase [Pseudomonas rhodesiae]NMY80845.1 oligosaccharide repeat unit polymerase [Pseudomonas rhodesiae]NMZ15979.1 oligosaccharide repeat unit polymerase [Pseudomonas rhodesiae]
MYSFIAGLALLGVSILSRATIRDMFHPSFIFPAIWGGGLCLIAFTPLLGFYAVESDALLIFILGGAIFSAVSIYISLFAKSLVHEGFFYRTLNFNDLFFLFAFMHLLVLPVAYSELSALGSGFEKISYAARAMSVAGESVFGRLTANYLLLGLVVIPLFTIALAQRRIGWLKYLIIAFPWCALILVGSGRAGLIQMLLGLVFIYRMVHQKLPIKIISALGLLFFIILFVGAIATNKIDVSSGESAGGVMSIMLRHIAGYALQGPILFSLYFDGTARVFENWNPFISVCHLLSMAQLCTPLPMHSEFNLYGDGLEGNVYSLYFSIFPGFGMLGMVLFIALYSAASTYAYLKAKQGNILYMVISGYLYSAIILSLFSDTFLPSLWFFMKVFVIVVFVLLFFSKKPIS